MRPIQSLRATQSPEHNCTPGEIYVRAAHDGLWYVESWDGQEPWPIGDGLATEATALEAAREAIAQTPTSHDA